jgi:hypothetical protein
VIDNTVVTTEVMIAPALTPLPDNSNLSTHVTMSLTHFHLTPIEDNVMDEYKHDVMNVKAQ